MTKEKKGIIKKNNKGLRSENINVVLAPVVIPIQVAILNKSNKKNSNFNKILFLIFCTNKKDTTIVIAKNIIFKDNPAISINLPPPPITISNKSIVKRIFNITFCLILYSSIFFLILYNLLLLKDISLIKMQKKFPHYILLL